MGRNVASANAHASPYVDSCAAERSRRSPFPQACPATQSQHMNKKNAGTKPALSY